MDQSPPPPSHIEYSTDTMLSSLPIKQQAIIMMENIEGWCSKQKASILMDIILQIRPEIVVEIGVFGGKSLIPMALALKANGIGKIYGIDAWDEDVSALNTINLEHGDWWATIDHNAILKELLKLIRKWNLQNQIELIIDTSENAPLISPIDVLHIDGNHSEINSLGDVTKWVPMVRPGGWIIFSDMNWCENGVCTTARAVQYLNATCEKFVDFAEGETWGIWIKP